MLIAKWKKVKDEKEERDDWRLEYYLEDKTKKEQCLECKKWVKELAEESGVCKGCKKKYE